MGHKLTPNSTTNFSCCLIDPPDMVKNVMSRESITKMLGAGLGGIDLARMPSYVVSKDSSTLGERVRENNLSYPLIGKPLAAASTRESHQLVVALNEEGLKQFPNPCIAQSYENHGGRLFKVYVLGKNTVRVFARDSLPNLPTSKDGYQFTKNFVAFDSQKRYPTLDDFGVGNVWEGGEENVWGGGKRKAR